MTRILPLVLIVAAGAGSYVAARAAADFVEDVTTDEITEVLDTDALNWADVAVDGLAVTLTGEAPDEATRFAALTAAGGIVDANRIANAMTVADAPDIAPPPFVIEILRNDDGISLIGLVPEGTDTTEISGLAERFSGGAPVSDLLETANHPAPDGWDAAVEFGLETLADLPRAKVSIEPGSVAVSAVTNAPAEKRALEARLTAAQPETVALDLDITAPRPVISPFTLRFVMDGSGPHFDACSADTEASRDQILKAAEAAGMTADAACPLGLGVPSRRWGDAASSAIAALAEIGGGTLTISNADVSLVAVKDAPQGLFDRVIGELDAALPEVFALTAVRPVTPEVDPDADAQPEFVATRSPEGLVQLRGRLASDRTRDVVESYAAAEFGTANLTQATRLDDTLPEGWSTRVLASLEALAVLDNGAVVVGPDSVAITGFTGRQDASAEISRLLSDALADGADFEIDVTYSEALDPEAGLPTPEECVANINALLDSNKITFAPSSSDIDPSAREVIDQIADIVRQCRDVEMEVAGHTDSQGRESMNLSLSQARADAVLNAILARRVLVSGLRAKGYGEAEPIADNGTAAGREANRRIEFTLIEPAPEAPEETAEAGDGTEEAEGTE